MNTSLQGTTYRMILIIIGGWLLYIGGSILQPLVFACLLAAFMSPLDDFFGRKIKQPGITISLSFIAILIPIILIGFLFSIQILSIIDSLPTIGNDLEAGFDKALYSLNKALPFIKLNSEELLSDSTNNLLDGPLNVMGQGLVSSSEILVGFGLTFLYTFFLLLYRKSFKNFIIFQFEKKNRKDTRETLDSIKKMVQSYMSGLGLVILILTILNTIGLLCIGVDYAIFWGALGGLLAVIPYVGTALGGFLPFIYSFATTESIVQPILVLVFYAIIQQIEGNFITPKVIGDKVNINPLFAIMSLVFFGSFWGIAGVILALPLISIIRIILEQIDETKPIALLMSSDIAQNYERFKKIAQSIN